MEALTYIQKEWAVLSSAPLTFFVTAVLTFGLAFIIARWYFSRTINEMRAAAETLNQRLLLKAEQMETYKERALKYDEKVNQIVTSGNDNLKDRVLTLVANIRELLNRYQHQNQSIHESEWSEMTQAKDESEKQKLWNKFTSAQMRVSNDLNAEYDRRFKVDTILLRDELRSRLPDYKPEREDRFLYEHPTNPIGMGMIADDLEKMAKLL